MNIARTPCRPEQLQDDGNSSHLPKRASDPSRAFSVTMTAVKAKGS